MKKWILRILTIFAVLCGLSLFGLKIVSGTSDSHKRGLEQAFSQIFAGNAEFKALKTFNLFPQFRMTIEDLTITGINIGGALKADSFDIGFGSFDLLSKNRRIEIFNLKNFTATEGVFTPLTLRLDDAGIYPDKAENKGKFTFNGKYGDKDVNGQFDMSMTEGVTPKYFFNDDNVFAINLGAVQISGLFHPYNKGGANLTALKLFAQKKGGVIDCEIPADKVFTLSDFFKDILGSVSSIKSPDDLTKLCYSLSKSKS